MVLDEQIRSLCEQAIADRLFPGCSIGITKRGQITRLAFGRLTYDNDAPKVGLETLYDVASITKSVPTGSLVLKLVEDGKIGLNDRVIDYIPELKNAHREQILIKHLLTYTVTFDLDGGVATLARANPDRVVEQLLRVPLVSPPGNSYWYTNGPAILMGLIIERIYGSPLDEVAWAELFGPLDMSSSTFSPNEIDPDSIAPTEIGPDGEIKGRVHDESSRAITASGERSGAAGLFSTAGDLLKYCQMLLGEGSADDRVRIFTPDTVKLMHTDQLHSMAERTGLGWELVPERLRGTHAGEQTFGKTGFTGCVMMIEPEKRAALVHLSNATYPTRPVSRDGINAFRRELADLVFAE
jgi:CubicO group peptidase (beta-lactamase class C family)